MSNENTITPEEYNDWACDVANDYAQARQEMCPDDFQSYEEYMEERFEAYLERINNPPSTVIEDYVDELPF